MDRGSSDVVAWVERTCAEQGLAVKVSDAATIAVVVTLLGLRQTRQTGSSRPGSKRLRPGMAARMTTRSSTDATIAR